MVLEDLVTREEKMGLVAFYPRNGRDFEGMKLVVGFCFLPSLVCLTRSGERN
jgi:hypothetical protein